MPRRAIMEGLFGVMSRRMFRRGHGPGQFWVKPMRQATSFEIGGGKDMDWWERMAGKRVRRRRKKAIVLDVDTREGVGEKKMRRIVLVSYEWRAFKNALDEREVLSCICSFAPWYNL